MHGVNKRIWDKIDESKSDKRVKEFLKSILWLELENFEEGRWRFAKDYEREIRKHALRHRGEA